MDNGLVHQLFSRLQIVTTAFSRLQIDTTDFSNHRNTIEIVINYIIKIPSSMTKVDSCMQCDKIT